MILSAGFPNQVVPICIRMLSEYMLLEAIEACPNFVSLRTILKDAPVGLPRLVVGCYIMDCSEMPRKVGLVQEFGTASRV